MRKEIKFIQSFLLICCLSFISLQKANAQDDVAFYSLNGVSVSIPNKHKLTIYSIYSPSDKVATLLALPTFTINKYLSFTAGYNYLVSKPGNGRTYTENQLLPHLIISIPLAKKWTLVDRNMYHHRFRNEGRTDLAFYRNRLGVVHKLNMFNKPSTIFLHNEFFINAMVGGYTRNRVIAGMEIKAFKFLSPQLMYIFQTDKGIGNRNLILLILTVPLENYGIFKKLPTKNKQ